MKSVGTVLRLSATDVTTFAACPHATMQAIGVAEGSRLRPPYYPDPSADLLAERGRLHEAAYVAKLRETRTVEEIPLDSSDPASLTLDAMRRGVEVIYQGTLRLGERWLGRPDLLLRTGAVSSLGAWSYQVADAKLARSAKASALLQLCFYSELLHHAQGTLPERMTLVLGDMHEEHFPTARYTAHFRYLRSRFEAALSTRSATYPEPVEHCHVCDYATECDAKRRADDHLSRCRHHDAATPLPRAARRPHHARARGGTARPALALRWDRVHRPDAHPRAGAHPGRGSRRERSPL